VGTIQTNRRGYCKMIPYKQAKRPKSMARGSYRIAHSKTEPGMLAVSWRDNRPVHFIATGCDTRPTRLSRRAGAEVVDRAPGKAPPTHAEFIRLMQTALLGVGAADFEGDLFVRALVDTP
ncbi:hypothetical protein PHYSODRAFT_417411, partial [Phytophthora sojae]